MKKFYVCLATCLMTMGLILCTVGDVRPAVAAGSFWKFGEVWGIGLMICLMECFPIIILWVIED